MAFFRRSEAQRAAFGSAPIHAAVGSAQAAREAGIGNFVRYKAGLQRERALAIPSIRRSRDLLVGQIASLPLEQYTMQWDGEEMQPVTMPPEPWMAQPDPNVTLQFILANTADDLIFYGSAYWWITARNSQGFPVSFTWLPAADIQIRDQSGSPQRFGPSNAVMFNGIELPNDDVVQFLAPSEGVLYSGSRTIWIAEQLDNAASRFASNEIAAGYLQEMPGSEPMTSDELAEMAAAWSSARLENAVGALNQYVKWVSFDMDPSKLQLAEGRQYAALDISRMMGIPPYLIGAELNRSMTYQNVADARQDLYQWGAKPIIDCISQTLSMNNVLPRGRCCRLGVEEYLEELLPDKDNETEEPTAPGENTPADQMQELPAA